MKLVELLLALVLMLFGMGATEYRDCGACGAHVSEWHYVQGANGTPVEVCERCYGIYVEYEEAQ